MTSVLAPSPPADLAPAAVPAGAWRVPLELVLASSSSDYVSLINRRRAHGSMPAADAQVFVEGGRFWALVDFAGPGRPGLLFALDLWEWEDRQPPRRTFGRRATPP